ncbi:MAG TPA: phosphoribosylformylglycinamidine synthase subunit PurS [Myxococcota bacterium]|nr:phosphoribosylformylglycinamidine synthase subunit PurS [Myxococcota bacterium]
MAENLYNVSVIVMPKAEILDPQGKAIIGALKSLEFCEVQDARIGKMVHLKMTGASREEVTARATSMAKSLLSNPVMEDFRVIVE